jgi:transcription termination/antitermination protein NusG
MRQDPKQGRNWYVLHTYSGYEDAVEKDLRQRIDSMNMQDLIFDVWVPKEIQYSIRKGETVEEKKKVFPGYILVEMIVTDESWYVVRNTPNVTGFVGSANTPVPITPEEFNVIKKRTSSDEGEFKSDFSEGETVQIIDGPFTSYKGTVDNIDKGKGRLKILVNVFERETPIELEFHQVKKLD